MEKYFYPTQNNFCTENCKVYPKIYIGTSACSLCEHKVATGVEQDESYIICKVIDKARGIEPKEPAIPVPTPKSTSVITINKTCQQTGKVLTTRVYNELENTDENLEIIKMWLDDQGAPEFNNFGLRNSVIGRIKALMGLVVV